MGRHRKISGHTCLQNQHAAVNVWPVVQSSDKDARLVYFDLILARTKIRHVHTVGYRVNVQGVACQTEQVRFGFADQKDCVSPMGRVVLHAPEPEPFSPIEPGTRAAARPGVIEPFLAIDIHHVHDGRHAFEFFESQVGSQARRRCQRNVIFAVADPLTYYVAKLRRPERAFGDRTAPRE